MRRRSIVTAVLIVAAISGFFLLRLQHQKPAAAQGENSPTRGNGRNDRSYPARRYADFGDILTDAQDPLFLDQVFPKFREFVGTLDHLGMNPFENGIQPASCSKIRIMQIPNGSLSKFIIGDGFTADVTVSPRFGGVTYFGQRGPDDPIRAISHANTNALRRLSQGAITMPEAEVWKIANRVAEAFGIDPGKFEKPQMYEEALFEYHLGIYSVRYRKKGSDPVNQMNYTRSFSLKATSPTSAVLVSYSHLDATFE